MSGSTARQHRPRLRWIIPAGIAVLLSLGGVAGNLVATDLDPVRKRYPFWVWAFYVIVIVIAVVVAVREYNKQDKSPDPKDEPAPKSEPPPIPRRALHQLPPPPRDFTGRVRELEELMSKIESGGVTISGLQGLGGIGKTALALKLAQKLAPRYTDAQFYLDLKGADKQPLSVAEALSHVIRAYHPTAKLPEGEAELQSLYLSLLHGRRALLLMDNAAGREQVEPLVPPESCILLVTSRQHFTLPGLFAKTLDTLTPDESRELLFKIAPRITERADEIAKLCGHLPLALRLAASALAERDNLSPADYVRRLSDAKKRLELVDASLTLSYELLIPEQQRLWRTLAVFPDTFAAAAAAAVWELNADAAQDALGELLRYSLLEWDADTSRYRLHDLARLFADSRMSNDEGHAARMRHADHYLTVLRECQAFYLKGGDAIKSGLALFDVERRNIEAGQEWACRHSSEDEAAARLCNEYPTAGVYVLFLRQHPREHIYWPEAALAAARKLKDRSLEGAHLSNLGIAHGHLGKYQQSIEYFEQFIEITRELGNRESEGRGLGNLGLSYAKMGKTRSAIEYYEQGLTILKEVGNRRDVASHLQNLGNAYEDLGEVHRASELLYEALNMFREINDLRGEGAVLGDLANVFAALGKTHHAITFYEQQLEIARDIGDRRSEANALFNAGLTLNELGNRAKAIAHVEAALKIYEQIESPGAKDARKLLAQWRGEA
jgi:tetratricopeptide (TPR) repeat protein